MSAEKEKTVAQKKSDEVCEDVEKRMVRWKVVLLDRNQAENLMRSLMTETVNADDAVIQRSGHDSVSRFQQGLERA